MNQVTLPSADLAPAVRFYQKIGFTLIVDALPRYARFEIPPDGDTLSLHISSGHRGECGHVIYFECDDLDERVDALRRAGVVFEKIPTDESWGWREARLRDPDGNELCLFFAGENRRFPPWRVAPKT